MNAHLFLSLAAGALIAGPAYAEPSEIGYPKGALGFSALVDADYSTAESQLRANNRVAKDDPALKLATYPADIQAAITSARITPGMSRDQVFMAVGYPVSSENPILAAPLLRFWTSSFAEFQVKFDHYYLESSLYTSGKVDAAVKKLQDA